MSSHTTFSPIKSTYIISYHIISYHIIAKSCPVALYQVNSYHIISYNIISYHIKSINIMLSLIRSYHIISYHIDAKSTPNRRNPKIANTLLYHSYQVVSHHRNSNQRTINFIIAQYLLFVDARFVIIQNHILGPNEQVLIMKTGIYKRSAFKNQVVSSASN